MNVQKNQFEGVFMIHDSSIRSVPDLNSLTKNAYSIGSYFEGGKFDVSSAAQ
ncbi:hypothetical protein DB44_EQ00050 [Candidatus Protochlamydia amoebophila]|uniref:Uncharacterized protein n=1 Tax=Candidatus Protochlamydia amoebophila TaxID=362787 RepID=A0A0C1H050_9BACT|nr:hypothetical protein DB44_EQ00050 [Candidatus Protochlamydia amoebophila]